MLLGQVGVERTKCWQHSQLSPPLQKEDSSLSVVCLLNFDLKAKFEKM